MSNLQNYQLKENLFYDELGELVLRKFNEIFKGKNHIEDTHDYKPGEPITYSNTPKALKMNNILIEESNGKIGLLTFVDAVRYINSVPERDSTYSDTNEITLFTNPGPNEDLRQRVLDILNLQDIDTPLIVSGLDVKPEDNDHGFTYIPSNNIDSSYEEAPFLSQDCKIKYENGKIISSDQGIPLWTPDSQTGLRGLYRLRSNLNARGENLLSSFGTGRVQIISYRKGL